MAGEGARGGPAQSDGARGGDPQGGPAGGSVLRPILDVLGLLVAAIVISLLVGVVFLVPTVALGYDVGTTPVLLGATAAGQLGFLLVAFWYVRRRGIAVPIATPSAREFGIAGVGVVAALALSMLLSVVLAAFDLLPSSVLDEVVWTDPAFVLGLAVLSVVLIAPAEEFLFRGAIQGRLRQRVGPVPAVVGSSLLFGSVHLTNYVGNPGSILAGAALIAVSGSVLGALYEYTGNLVVPIVTHGIYNVIVALFTLAAP